MKLSQLAGATEHRAGTKGLRPNDVALLCNPLAGGRWHALADVLDSPEAKSVHRIVTDDIDDVREAIGGLGKRVKLLCIYGGDGTIYHVLNELLRDPNVTPPRVALLGGGTMNVTAAWCGMKHSPGENFRGVMRAFLADRLLWRDVPLVSVTQGERTAYGFTFGMGPLVRILARFEEGTKSRAAAVGIGLQSIASAVIGRPRDHQGLLEEMRARITADGTVLAFERWAAVFANVTGVINPMITPFVGTRTRDSFHFLAYAVSAREFAVRAPLLARARLPVDARALLRPSSTWRRALQSVVAGGVGLPADARYHNRAVRDVVLETDEPYYTIDGEVFRSLARRTELRLGPQLQLATLRPRWGATDA